MDASRPVLTKYERAKVVGMRAEQLARGMEPLVPVPADEPFDPEEVARRELLAGRLPFVVVRHTPDGKPVHLRLADLVVPPW
jgi:DNA-directed RNA polymerase subunit K/omega